MIEQEKLNADSVSTSFKKQSCGTDLPNQLVLNVVVVVVVV
jgi:hypothetical protein